MKIINIRTILYERMVRRAEEMIKCQMYEKKKLDESEVNDINFEVKVDKSFFHTFLIMWLVIFVIFFNTFGSNIFQEMKDGNIFDISYYSITSATCMILVVMAAVSVILCYICMITKPVPKVKNTYMIYKGKKYHVSEITEVRIGKMNQAKVYIHGKYAFWLSGDFINYRSFIEWLRKCKVLIKGDAEIRQIGNINHVNEKIVMLVLGPLIAMVVSFVIALLLLSVMNRF